MVRHLLLINRGWCKQPSFPYVNHFLVITLRSEILISWAIHCHVSPRVGLPNFLDIFSTTIYSKYSRTFRFNQIL